MTVFHIAKNTNYTVMSNHHLRNRELSLKAKGLLSQMLSLPEKWDYTLQGLAYINREPSMSWRGPDISCGRESGTAGDGCGERSTPSMKNPSGRPINRHWINLCRENRCRKILRR